MASSSSSTAKVHNFVVPKRARNYQPPSRPQVAAEEDMKPVQIKSPSPKAKRSRMAAPAAKKEEEKIKAKVNKNRVSNGEGKEKEKKVEENRVCETPNGEGADKGKEKVEEEEEPKKKRKKLGITIPLNRWEIAQDMYAFTGKKPSNHPRKHSKAVQKDLEGTFPGEYLGSITRERYRVSGPPRKRRKR